MNLQRARVAGNRTNGEAESTPVEIDHSSPTGDDHTLLARDAVPVRTLSHNDFDAILSIDTHVTRRNRAEYLRRKFSEALDEAGIRVSLVAEIDGLAAGFIMARVDYGEFGRTAATAVIDTIGVDPAWEHAGVGHALMSQLLANLEALRVDDVRTEVDWHYFRLNRFLADCGFTPAQRVALSLTLAQDQCP
ncbi:MAG: GNAT family N-acetyltransferase [Gammaproteobacteria bacterium]|nr:GNAT family N-acetyltransferase [Gammaproteobacteria bacterium]